MMMLLSRSAQMTTVVASVVSVALLLVAAANLAEAKYVNGVGFNLMRATLSVPQQPHQISLPELDTSAVAQRVVKEAAVVCDPIAPVQRTVTCEIHTFDECGNVFGTALNTTVGWDIVVQEMNFPGATNRLVSPIAWVTKGVGRFYFTPLRVGLYRVLVGRNTAKPKTIDLLAKTNLANYGGFIVRVHDALIKGTSANIGQATLETQQMMWTQATHNTQLRPVPPATPATTVFEDRKHVYANRAYGQSQDTVRRPPVQPQTFPSLPSFIPYADNNAFRYVDLVL